MKICIPKEALKKLISKMNDFGTDPLDVLEKMGSTKRKEFFSQFVGEEVSKGLNIGFEKAILKGDADSIISWAKKNLKPQQVEEITKKKSDFEAAVQSGEIYQDLVNKQLGTEMTEEEVKRFSELGKQVFDIGEEIKKGGLNELGNLLDKKSLKLQEDFLKKIDELNEYAQSISPHASLWKRYTTNNWKAGVLLTLKSFNLNTIGNATVFLGERIIDRIINKTLGGKLTKEKGEYIKNVFRIYKNTNFDFSRAESLNPKDSVVGAGRYAGEEIVTPKSEVMKLVSKITFKYSLGVPDVIAGAAHRADSMGIQAEAITKKLGKVEGFEGLEGDTLRRALFEDASRIEPRTKAGELIKKISIHNARVGTYTDNGRLAEAGLELKQILNKAGNLGELLTPFVKTPSNVIGLSFEYAGAGVPEASWKLLRNFLDKKYDLEPFEVDENIRKLVRGGFGLSAALIFASLVDLEDYIGSYDPRETKSRDIKGGTPDSVKIGGKYYSFDYFGILRVPMKLMIENRVREGVNAAVLSAASTIMSELANTPLLAAMDIKKTVEDVASQKGDMAKVLKDFPEKALGRFYSGLPLASQIGDIVKAFDPEQAKRDTSTDQFSLYGLSLDKVAEKLPFLRDDLPKKINVFGETVPSAGLGNLFFGERVSTAIQNKITDEFKKLEKTGNDPSITDITYSNSEKLARITEKIGKREMINEKEKLGKKFSDDLNKVLDSEQYKGIEDNEDKKALIESVFKNRYNEFLRDNGEYEDYETKSIDEILLDSHFRGDYGVGGVINLENFTMAENIGSATLPELAAEWRRIRKADKNGKPLTPGRDDLFSHEKKVELLKGTPKENLMEKMPKNWIPGQSVLIDGAKVQEGEKNAVNPKKKQEMGKAESIANNPIFLGLPKERRKKMILRAYEEGKITQDEGKMLSRIP